MSSTTPTNNGIPPALPPKRAFAKGNISDAPHSPAVLEEPESPPLKSLPDLLEHTAGKSEDEEGGEVGGACDKDLMEKMDVTKYLVLKKAEDDGPEIRGGYTDALIIMATKATKNGGK